MPPTPPGAPAPRPADVPGGVFDPDDPYWADVPLIEARPDGTVDLLRGELPGRLGPSLLTGPRSQLIPDGVGVFGVLVNPDAPQQRAVLVPVGAHAIDFRRCVILRLGDELLSGFVDATERDYLGDLRRHVKRVQDLVDAGYVLVRRDRSMFELWLAKP